MPGTMAWPRLPSRIRGSGATLCVMTCRHCVEAGALFGSSLARRELRRYRRRGPSSSTRLLLEGLRTEGAMGDAPDSARDSVRGSARDSTGAPADQPVVLLDIGGGVGALQHAFVAESNGDVVGVDASPAYLDAVRVEAERDGTGDRYRYILGDAVQLSETLPRARVVTLDRVLCCYPDMPALVSASAGRAEKWWGIVVPRERWVVRFGVGVINLVQWLRRQTFRVYLHGRETMEAHARKEGLTLVRRERTALWEVLLFRR